MALVWVQAGECGNETTIEARRTDVTHVAVEFITTGRQIQELAAAMEALDIAHEMSALLVFIFSGLLAMAGLGTAFLFVPLFYYLGVPLAEATPTALLLNAVNSTAFQSPEDIGGLGSRGQSGR